MPRSYGLDMSDYGPLLKSWRAERRRSQLDLGLEASVSARHISFLETGRARPSRAMVIMLSEALDVPRSVRNQMLTAAGFAHAYRAHDPDTEAMAPVHAALDWTLSRHDPYPAFALDRLWRITAANRMAARMLAGLGVGIGDNVIAPVLGGGGAALFENWPEVARHMVHRLRTEAAHYGGEPELEAWADEIAAELGSKAWEAAPASPVIPARYRVGGQVLSLFSTLAQFGTAEDIALADLRIELMFPADDATRLTLEALASA